MTAAAVNQVGAAQSAGAEHFVHIVLHEHLQEERAAAQGALCARRRHGINEPLNAGHIRRDHQKRRFPAENGLMVKQPRLIVRLLRLQQIFADAGANGGGHFEMVIK